MKYGIVYFIVGIASAAIGIFLMKDFIFQFFKFAAGIVLFILGLQLVFRTR